MVDVHKRDHRDHAGTEQRAPRSGGRTTVERPVPERVTSARPAVAVRQTRARGAREFPTQGSAALRPSALATATGRDRAASARDSARQAHPAGAGRVEPPSLRVAPPLPVAVPRAPFVGLILAVVVGGVLGVLVINTKINENAIRLDKLQREQAALDLREQQLNQELAAARAPGNLTAEARKLGLVESGTPAFLRLPDGRVIGVPQPAGGAPAITSQQNPGG